MKYNRFQELDMMRGFAACWVIGIHYWYFNVLPPFFGYSNFFEYQKVVGLATTLPKFFPLPFNSVGNIIFDGLNIFFMLGYQGVHIFFILSGFGLTYSRILKPDESWSIFMKKKIPALPYLLDTFSCIFDNSSVKRGFILWRFSLVFIVEKFYYSRSSHTIFLVYVPTNSILFVFLLAI